jgi:Ca2+-binding RTX toxin-like protein
VSGGAWGASGLRSAVGISKMAAITGTTGDDFLTGTSGDDVIDALEGADGINGGFGNDVIRGGDGNDYIRSFAGSDDIDAGAGDDRLDIDHRDSATTTARMGDGKDSVQIFSFGAHKSIVDTGAGDDYVEMIAIADGGSARLTLGAGRDSIYLGAFYGQTNSMATGSLVVTDFQAGAAGDRIDWLDLLTRHLSGWDGAANPFATGHVRLLQDGADALLQIDLNGGANDFVTLVTFENVTASAFTYDNLDGFPIDGTIPAGLALTGTEDTDRMFGAAGGDQIDGLGGLDHLYGGTGDDTLRGGAGQDWLYGEYGADRLEGGEGDDVLDGGRGNDMLLGGDGRDYLYGLDGHDTLDGGADNDSISLVRGSLHHSDEVTGIGGSGDDVFLIQSLSSSHIILDAGTGNDSVTVFILGGRADLTLGEGVDTIHIEGGYHQYLLQTGSIVISDFQAGAGGDVLTLHELPHAYIIDNPFGSGGLRLVQSGSDTLLQEGWHSAGWRTIVTFTGVALGSLVAENFGGFPPDGSPAPGSVITGTELADHLNGTAGSDRISGLGNDDNIHAGTGADLVEGGAGNDTVYAGPGNDTVYAGEGNDYIDDGHGDDLIDLGPGNDQISSNHGNDIIYGGDGDDVITAQRQGETIGYPRVFGGDGADTISLFIYNGVGTAVDAGSGDDFIEVYGVIGAATLTLGAGSDLLDLIGAGWYEYGTITVTDFAAGAGGDRLALAQFAASRLQNWTPGANPFATGHLRFVQAGPDARLEINRDGAGTDFLLLATFQNLDLWSLIPANLEGFELSTKGTAGADTIIGKATVDLVDGLEGNDSLRLQQGGIDRAYGSAGNDSFYFGAAYTAEDLIDGGTERDQLALQGNYNLILGNIAGVEDLILLSGTDTRFGDTAGNPYTYVIHSSDSNVAAGAKLLVDSTMLVAGESLTFDGTAETDGKFLFSGGQGTDIFSGGAGADGFYFRDGSFWNAGDRVLGGAGDQIGFRGDFTGANKVVMGANQIVTVETLVLMSGLDLRFGPIVPPTKFDITMHDGNLASGRRFTVDASQLAANETARVDASAETDGTYRMFGGAGADELIGGANADFLRGGLGADILKGNGGADTFAYTSAAQSTSTAFDLLVDVKSAEDRIDLHSSVSGWSSSVTSGQLSHSSFDADLAAALDAALGPNQAILFDPTSGDYAGRHFLVVDADGDGAYTAGADYVFELGNAAVIDTSGMGIFA